MSTAGSLRTQHVANVEEILDAIGKIERYVEGLMAASVLLLTRLEPL
jgi:hypothetical protein